jgi:hypothetical protein
MTSTLTRKSLNKIAAAAKIRQRKFGSKSFKVVYMGFDQINLFLQQLHEQLHAMNLSERVH